jgi:transcriptional regulator with XRE-family HTH domain
MTKTKNHFATNLKLLRKRKKRSQEEVSKSIEVSRSAYNSYENGGIEPNFGTLLNLSTYFSVSLDKLVKIDLSKIGEMALSQLEKGFDMDLKGSNLRILTTTVNQHNENNVELVPAQARAGYTTGFADPEFIKILPAFNLPFLSEKKKYRTFPIKGDSMPPVKDGAFVTAEYVENWHLIQNGFPYIIVTQDDGIVFKTVYHDLGKNPTLTLCSTNPEYDPYEVDVRNILEVWKFVNYINHEFEAESMENAEITSTLLDIKKDISSIKSAVNLS